MLSLMRPSSESLGIWVVWGNLQDKWEAQISLLAFPFFPLCKEMVFKACAILDVEIDSQKLPIW